MNRMDLGKCVAVRGVGRESVTLHAVKLAVDHAMDRKEQEMLLEMRSFDEWKGQISFIVSGDMMEAVERKMRRIGWRYRFSGYLQPPFRWEPPAVLALRVV